MHKDWFEAVVVINGEERTCQVRFDDPAFGPVEKIEFVSFEEFQSDL